MSRTKKLLSVSNVANRLGFCNAHVRKLCATGKIKAHKVGNGWFMSENAIKNLKRQRKSKGESSNGTIERSPETDSDVG